MSKTTFLINEQYWQKLQKSIKGARYVEAAIAYFGSEGAKILKLRPGDRLIVDMSISTVKAGGTNPYEVENLINKGISVFTRKNLHAKIVIVDKSIFVGSANISNNSQKFLDEAAIFTNDRVSVLRAQNFIERCCSEPVMPEYLEECKKVYSPPKFKNGKKTSVKSSRATHAKLWIVSLQAGYVPDAEIGEYEKGEEKALKNIDAKKSKADSFHWPYKPKMADEIEPGDWMIQIVEQADKQTIVHPPGQFLLLHKYIRNKKTGQKRYVFHLEIPKRLRSLKWVRFKKIGASILSKEKLAKPRTMPVRGIDAADGLLRIWKSAFYGHAARRNYERYIQY